MPYVCNNVFSGPTNSVITDSIVLKITTFCVDCSDDRLGRGSTAVLANAGGGSWAPGQIGRAAGRGRGEASGVAGSFKKK